MLFLGGPIFLYLDVAEARDHNAKIEKLLRQMDKAAPLLAKRRGERATLDLRYAKPAPALATFIESAASAQGLEVPESTDRPDVKTATHLQRTTVVKMRKVNLKPLIQMLEQIERSGHPVAVDSLSIKTRPEGPDAYDVSLGISAYDKVGATAPSDGDKGKAPAPKAKTGPRPKGTEL
jgi:general secretion pathway protein M